MNIDKARDLGPQVWLSEEFDWLPEEEDSESTLRREGLVLRALEKRARRVFPDRFPERGGEDCFEDGARVDKEGAFPMPAVVVRQSLASGRSNMSFRRLIER